MQALANNPSNMARKYNDGKIKMLREFLNLMPISKELYEDVMAWYVEFA